MIFRANIITSEVCFCRERHEEGQIDIVVMELLLLRRRLGFSLAFAPVKEALRGDEAWLARCHGPAARHERRHHATQCAQAWIRSKLMRENGAQIGRIINFCMGNGCLVGRTTSMA